MLVKYNGPKPTLYGLGIISEPRPHHTPPTLIIDPPKPLLLLDNADLLWLNDSNAKTKYFSLLAQSIANMVQIGKTTHLAPLQK